MRIFVTGATGWVGSAVVNDLITHGHEIIGLVRSDEGAARLSTAGAQALRGSIDDLALLRSAAEEVDGVIHTAFNHDWSRFAENCEVERAAITALGSVLQGSERPLIVTSGVALLAPGRVAKEEDVAPAVTRNFPRAAEAVVADLQTRGVRATTVRLAPSVHGIGDHGFVPRLAAIARESGVSAYIGDGDNRWPGVHRHDAARLFRLALKNPAAGPFHAVADEGVPLRAIAQAIGRRFDLPVVSKNTEEAAAHFGWFAAFVGLDAPASSEHTRSILGWDPKERCLLDDLAQPEYFGAS